ncbi:hypothetical protein [Sporosarcina sp. E16_8]|uniref:hypothetical protein n=1 Tax=Sporosarcina sp. E16_8 TaxID=2789295 RepID=UPI001A91E21D|nr:hypothetical protein [Sporosarcina sp. E16_8]MBO0586795.1 hypothetical protein [Sporosarcina sp. E16_8]
MESLKRLLGFLNSLEDKKIDYKLNKIRNEAIMVEIAVPGQLWEVEFMDDGTIEIEKFINDGGFYDGEELKTLFEKFSD